MDNPGFVYDEVTRSDVESLQMLQLLSTDSDTSLPDCNAPAKW